MSKQEAQKFILNNKSKLKHIIDLCKKEPLLELVYDKDVVLYDDVNITDETKESIKEIQKLLKEFDICRAECVRF
jgi:hypothetical protein